ncbi:MAG: hypothetical protein KF878_00035 [Planctomycetes bacterium]|nr:hypothetical protein [Planctomycetota bacterium]
MIVGFGGVGIVSQEERSRSPALVRAPRSYASAGAAGAGGAWKFAVVDPDFIATISPTSPQSTVRVDVLGSTRASLTEAPTRTGVDAEQAATAARIFHKSELVGVRETDGEWRIAKLYTVASLVTAIEEGDVWARGYFGSGGTWLDEALDLAAALNSIGGFPGTTSTTFQTLNASDATWRGVVAIGWERISPTARDIAWPFLPVSGQTVSTINPGGPPAAGTFSGKSFAFPPGASTGSVHGSVV